MRKKQWLTAAFGIIMCISIFTGGCSKQEEPVQSTEVSASETSAESTAETTKEPEADSEPQQPEARDIQAPSIAQEDYPQVDGSTATLPLSTALYQLVTGASAEEAEGSIVHTKTTNAYNRLIYGYETDLVIAYEPAPSVYELMEAEGVNLIIKPIGKDALVFMANEGNPVESLTGQQIVDIYKGTVKNWKEVGGTEKDIVAFQRPPGSGSQTLMEKLVMQEVPMDPSAPTTSIIADMGELIEAVASYNNEENALGYSVYFYAQNMFVRPGLRFMKVDGVEPSNETIKSGKYPYVNEFYAAIREDEPEDSYARQLFDWLTTSDGQALVEELGYVGLQEEPYPYRLQLEDGSVTGDADIPFEEDQRLLLDCRYAYGTEGVAVLNEKMEIEKVIRDVSMDGNAAVVRLSDPVILKSKEAYAGIYDIEHDTWIVEPHYMDLYRRDDGTYRGYLVSFNSGARRMILSWDGQNFDIKEEIPEQIGDHIWKVLEKEKKAVITDLAGTTVKEIDFQEYGAYQHGFMQNPYYIAYYQGGDFVMFASDGQVLFRKEFLDSRFMDQMRALDGSKGGNDRIIFSSISGDGALIQCLYGERNWPFIYSLKQNKVMTQPGDKTDIYLSDDENYYFVNGEMHRSDGTKMLSSDGKPYTHVLGKGYYAVQEETALVVEGKKRGDRYVLPVTKADFVTAIAEGLFHVSAHWGTKGGIYKGETCLIEGEGAAWWICDEKYCVVTDYYNHDRNMLLDKQGNILYESDIPQSIGYAGNGLVVSTRGNYLYVTDYEGRCALRLLLGYMGDD